MTMVTLSETIGEIIDEHMALRAVSGAVVLVARHGHIEALTARGFADWQASFELRPDSIFGVMSMTKPVIAACAMILIADGKISLDDPASRFIPEFAKPRRVRTLKPGQSYPPFPPKPDEPPPAEPEYDYADAETEITVRHILTFTSGLQTIGVPNGMPPLLAEDSLASYVARLDTLPLEFQPGTQWHYSNMTGYDVLGRIIEVACGQDLRTFAQERVFGPLGMSQTQFGANPRLQSRIVPLGPLSNSPPTRTDYACGSAGLFSTAQDFWKFAQMLLDEGMYEGRPIMPRSAVRSMQHRQIGDLPFNGIRVSAYAQPTHRTPSPFTYGFGVGVLATSVPEEGLPAGSFGWDGVGTRRFWVVPAKSLIIIMLMPGMGTGAEPAHKAIEAAVLHWAEDD